ncbi:MAG: YbaB/EbfC family nucleoid-associated protein, partial [Candidatus Omnitrophica bacterium]|nr:YbaB/EbfC family nucleoid-associated protein [Candidatus Omnitrophota bacterium]
SSSDGLVKVTMNGSQEVKAILLADASPEAPKTKLEEALKDAYNRAIKQSQKIAAQKMKDAAGLNLPGLF